MRKKIITIVAILIIFVLVSAVLFNVFKKEEDNGLTKVKVAEVAHSIFYAPQYAAISLGYFEEYGIDIDLTLVPGEDKEVITINLLKICKELLFLYLNL